MADEKGAQMPSTSEPPTERGKRTRERLLVAAREVFERDGFLEARLSDIAKTAGVSFGTFYTYFASKEAIFKELASRLQADMVAGPRSPGSSRWEEDPILALERANRRYLESYARNAALMGVIDQVSSFNKDLKGIREERAHSFASKAAHAIKRLQEMGLADPRIHPHYAASALTSMMSRFAYIWFVDPPGAEFKFDFDEAVQQLTLLWANAIGLSGPSRVQDGSRPRVVKNKKELGKGKTV